MKEVLKQFNIGDIVELFALLSEMGLSKDEAIEQLATAMDKAVDFSVLIKEPYGSAIELIDKPVFKATLNICWLMGKRLQKRKAKHAKRNMAKLERAEEAVRVNREG